MKVLLVKTSSIGDLLHAMPAITDAARNLPDLELDWLVEEALVPVCRWHPAVSEVVTVAYRRWRRHPIKGLFGGGLAGFRRDLRARRYDLVIDAQGLYKSGVMTALSNGAVKHGYDLASCREKLAPLAYRVRHRVLRTQHAVQRNRTLFSLAFGYPLPDTEPDFGLDRARFPRPAHDGPYLLGLHGTNWRTKLWPVARWRALARLAAGSGMALCVPWFSVADERRARAIGRGLDTVWAPKADIEATGGLIAHAASVVAVETGLGHLSSALEVPTVALYGPTNRDSHAMIGRAPTPCTAALACSPCHNKICNLTVNARAPAPCMVEISAATVWHRLGPGLEESRRAGRPAAVARAAD